MVALPFQIYTLTHSSLLVGLIGLVALVPLLAGAVTAGAIADSFDRRRLLVISQVIAAACLAALAVLAARGDPPLVALYAIAAVQAFASAIESPVRNAVVPQLVGLERVPAASALNQTVDQLSADRRARGRRPAAGGRRVDPDVYRSAPAATASRSPPPRCCRRFARTGRVRRPGCARSWTGCASPAAGRRCWARSRST